MQEDKECSYEEMPPTPAWDVLLLPLSTALPAPLLCCQPATALSGLYRLPLRCPRAAGKLMDATYPETGEDSGTILGPWESSAVPALNRDPTAGSLMKETQGAYRTHCACMHTHAPHFRKCSSKAHSVEFLQPTISLEITPLPEEFANNNDWPLFKTLTRAGGRWFTTRQSAKQTITVQMCLDQIQGSIRCGTDYRLDHISHKPH